MRKITEKQAERMARFVDQIAGYSDAGELTISGIFTEARAIAKDLRDGPTEAAEQTKRLYVGVLSVVKKSGGGVTDIRNEIFVDWAESRAAAIGSWVARLPEICPGYDLSQTGAYDITEIARSG